jgi:hypothetical protein
LGVRETRRFSGIRTVIEEDVLSGKVYDDTICLSGYKIDIHSGKDVGLYFKAVEKPFGIPYGSLVSKDIDNLMFAGRCISCDAIALGSLRVISSCLGIGQAAGVGASLAVKDKILPKNVAVDEVRSILEEKGKIYTQLKIDEITNLGAVKIRLRSLFAAIGHKES